MAWCPKCRNEYKEGITECVDCQVPLVDELPNENEIPSSVLGETDSEETAQKIVTYLMYKGLQTPFIEQIVEDDSILYRVIVAEFERIDAEMFLHEVFPFATYEETSFSDFIPGIEDKLNELKSEEAEHMLSDLRTEQSTIYVKKRDKYNDLKFSGISFIILGLLGLAAVILNHYKQFVNLETYSLVIMGGVFLLFAVIGVNSLIRAKKIKGLVSEETEESDEVITWIAENITDDFIRSYYDEDDTEENNYFTVHHRLCEIAIENFPHFPVEYIEELMDERYNQFCDEINETEH